MRKITKIITLILFLYILLSVLLSLAYGLFPSIAWDIASHRNGLAIVEFSYTNKALEGWLLNPLTNFGDDWIRLF